MTNTEMRAAMASLRMSSVELNKLSGLSLSTISRMLNGHCEVAVYVATILKLTQENRELHGAFKAFSKNMAAG